jgi:peptidoglycan hydrolase-like protein with peptidoglycan-binding domain
MKSDSGSKSGAMRSSRQGSGGGGAAMGDDKVKAVQQALKDKGHDPGDVDGKMGPKTQAALRDFQKAQGLQGSGRLDDKTMQALGVGGGSTGTGGSASPTTGGSSSTGGSGSTSSGGATSGGATSGGATSGGGSTGSSASGGSSSGSSAPSQKK